MSDVSDEQLPYEKRERESIRAKQMFEGPGLSLTRLISECTSSSSHPSLAALNKYSTDAVCQALMLRAVTEPRRCSVTCMGPMPPSFDMVTDMQCRCGRESYIDPEASHPEVGPAVCTRRKTLVTPLYALYLTFALS